MRASTLLGGPAVDVLQDFGGVQEVDGSVVLEVVGRAVRGACSGFVSAVRLQGMMGEGPLQIMDDVELQHWMALVAARTAAAALASAQPLLVTFDSSKGPATASFSTRTEYGVLPADDPRSTVAVLRRVIIAIEGGATTTSALEPLEDAEDAAAEMFVGGLSPSLPIQVSQAAQLIGGALVLAHLLDRMLGDRPARVSDAPAWFEAAASLVRLQLRVLVIGAAENTLETPAALLAAALGEEHPVAREATALAEANLSTAVRREREERERVRMALLAEALLVEEWPEESEMAAARAADREAKTPVPERVWALRNVAGTLALGGPGERGRARQLLERAVLLKQEFAGAPDHPGKVRETNTHQSSSQVGYMHNNSHTTLPPAHTFASQIQPSIQLWCLSAACLPELVALGQVLSSEPEWAADEAGVAALVMRILLAIGEGYRRVGDPLSATVLLEAAMRQYEEVLGLRHHMVNMATKSVEVLNALLLDEQKAMLAAARGRDSSDLIQRVVSALTEELGAYKDSVGASKAQEWDVKGVALIGPLLAS